MGRQHSVVRKPGCKVKRKSATEQQQTRSGGTPRAKGRTQRAKSARSSLMEKIPRKLGARELSRLVLSGQLKVSKSAVKTLEFNYQPNGGDEKSPSAEGAHATSPGTPREKPSPEQLNYYQSRLHRTIESCQANLRLSSSTSITKPSAPTTSTPSAATTVTNVTATASASAMSTSPGNAGDQTSGQTPVRPSSRSVSKEQGSAHQDDLAAQLPVPPRKRKSFKSLSGPIYFLLFHSHRIHSYSTPFLQIHIKKHLKMANFSLNLNNFSSWLKCWWVPS